MAPAALDFLPCVPVTDALSPRQQRERDYYEQFSRRNEYTEVSFDPVESPHRRPWNSYWFQYEFVLDRFRAGARRLLDYGCGPGVPAIRFAKIGYDVHGFDLCERNVASARCLARRYGLQDRTHFETQAAERLNYPDGVFDVVSGFDILHHVEMEAAIRETRRVLKRDGVAIFREPIEVPAFDRIRNTRLGRWLVPNDKSFERHITEDERKLSAADVAVLRRYFPGLVTQRFCLTSRFAPYTPFSRMLHASALERFDRAMFKAIPPSQALGGCAVFILRR